MAGEFWMTCDTVVTLTAASMRDREAIRLRAPTAAVRRSIHEHGIEPSSRHVDELLDERLAHCSRPRGVRSEVVAGVGDLQDSSNVLLKIRLRFWLALQLLDYLLALIR